MQEVNWITLVSAFIGTIIGGVIVIMGNYLLQKQRIEYEAEENRKIYLRELKKIYFMGVNELMSSLRLLQFLLIGWQRDLRNEDKKDTVVYMTRNLMFSLHSYTMIFPLDLFLRLINCLTRIMDLTIEEVAGKEEKIKKEIDEIGIDILFVQNKIKEFYELGSEIKTS